MESLFFVSLVVPLLVSVLGGPPGGICRELSVSVHECLYKELVSLSLWMLLVCPLQMGNINTEN